MAKMFLAHMESLHNNMARITGYLLTPPMVVRRVFFVLFLFSLELLFRVFFNVSFLSKFVLCVRIKFAAIQEWATGSPRWSFLGRPVKDLSTDR